MGWPSLDLLSKVGEGPANFPCYPVGFAPQASLGRGGESCRGIADWVGSDPSCEGRPTRLKAFQGCAEENQRGLGGGFESLTLKAGALGPWADGGSKTTAAGKRGHFK